MHIESCGSRNWNAWLDPPWLQEACSNSTFVLRRTASNQDGIWAAVLRGEMSAAHNTDKELRVSRWKDARQVTGLHFYLINLFPEFQTSYLLSSLGKKVGLRWDIKTDFRVHNLPSSQITDIWIKRP